MTTDSKLKKLGLFPSFSIYVVAALIMFIQTNFTIPYLSKVTGQETILFWFIVAAIGVFTPLIILGLIILKIEGFQINRETITSRLRFRKLTKSNLIYTLIGFLAIAILSGLIMKLLEIIVGQFDHSPKFMSFEPLTKGRYWLLLIWIPYWILNILGEEFLWRGVMRPGIPGLV